MKRIVSVFLSFLILLCCVIPVSAASVGYDSSVEEFSYDLLPYLNQTYFDTSSGSSGTNYRFLSSIGLSNSYRYIEILFETDDSSPFIGTSTASLYVNYIGDNLYRAYGSLNSGFDSDFFFYFKKSNGTYFNLLKCDVSIVKNNVFDVDVRYHVTGNYEYRISIGSDSQAFDVFPVTVDYSGTISNTNVNDYFIYAPVLPAASMDERRTANLTTWFSFDWIKYDRVSLFFYTYGDSVNDDWFAYVDGINVLVDAVGLNDEWTLLTLDFSNLSRSDLSSTCSIYHSGTYDITKSATNPIFRFYDVKGVVYTTSNNFWPSWLIRILDKLESINLGSSSQNSAASDFQDSVSNQSAELESMTNVMNSVERPDINTINISSGSMVDSSSLVLATSGISSIMGNSIILRVILMGLTFGLIGFVLYGKKG